MIHRGLSYCAPYRHMLLDGDMNPVPDPLTHKPQIATINRGKADGWNHALAQDGSRHRWILAQRNRRLTRGGEVKRLLVAVLALAIVAAGCSAPVVQPVPTATPAVAADSIVRDTAVARLDSMLLAARQEQKRDDMNTRVTIACLLALLMLGVIQIPGR